jgi:hypothetical protein
VVVSLFIISAALLLVLLSIQRGLEHLDASRREFQAVLDLETVASSLALGIDQSEDFPWETEEFSPVPELTLFRVTVPAGALPVHAWLLPPEPEPEEPAPDAPPGEEP